MDSGKHFKMLLPYEDKMELVHVQELSDETYLKFFIEFNDGFKNVFFIPKFEASGMSGCEHLWQEENLGITNLSTTVGAELEKFIESSTEYEEPFLIKALTKPYVVQPMSIFTKLLFKIFKKGHFLFTIQLGEDGTWEDASSGHTTEIIQIIGEEIEQVFS